MQTAQVLPLTQQKLFDTTFLNVEWLFNKIIEFFNTIFGTDFLYWIWIIFIVIAILLICFIIYLILKVREVKEKEKISLHSRFVDTEKMEEVKNDRWEVVKKHGFSDAPSDWKMAIIEADLILDEMVEKMNYPGENLGERLKQIQPGDFPLIDSAWEAHKVRNRIAHEGSDFQLTEHEKNRVLGLYERIFRHFGYI